MVDSRNMENLDAIFNEIYGDADKFRGLEICIPETGLGVYAIEDPLLDYYNSGYNGRGLDTPVSHSEALSHSFTRPFLGPLFEVKIPNVGQIGFYIPCTHIKIDEDNTINDVFSSEYKHGPNAGETYYGLNEIRSRLLLTTTGILDLSDPSASDKFNNFIAHPRSQDYQNIADKLNEAYEKDGRKEGENFRAVALNLLEGLRLDQMTPAYSFCVHEYKIPEINFDKPLKGQNISSVGCDVKIPSNISTFDIDGFKRLQYLIDNPELLLSITDKLRDLCVDYYTRKMSFLVTGHLQKDIRYGSPEYYNELKALIPGIGIWCESPQQVEDKFAELCPDNFIEQKLGLNFTIALMECLVSARYIQNEMKVYKYRDPRTGNLRKDIPTSAKINKDASKAAAAYSFIDNDRRRTVLEILYAFETGRATQQDIDTIHEVLKPCKPNEVSL